jgi:hypothetical protein
VGSGMNSGKLDGGSINFPFSYPHPYRSKFFTFKIVFELILSDSKLAHIFNSLTAVFKLLLVFYIKALIKTSGLNNSAKLSSSYSN